jgi:hypothetical protein
LGAIKSAEILETTLTGEMLKEKTSLVVELRNPRTQMHHKRPPPPVEILSGTWHWTTISWMRAKQQQHRSNWTMMKDSSKMSLRNLCSQPNRPRTDTPLK